MTLNAVIAFILRFLTEFDRFSAGYITVVNVRKILSSISSPLLLAKTIMHTAARFLCDSRASCISRIFAKGVFVKCTYFNVQ